MAGSAFRAGQRLGVDLLPRHFYSAVPDIRELQRSTHWRAPRSMVGVQGTDTASQLAFVASCCTPEIVERLRRNDVHAHAVAENGDMGYGPTEADFLYAVIRPPPDASRAGRRGCLDRNHATRRAGWWLPDRSGLRGPLSDGVSAPRALREATPSDRREGPGGRLSQLTDVGENGMLFLDSTHTVKVGSEVNRIVLEVLPRLARGTLVHFHDICFPYDYSPEVLRSTLFWTESTLLHAFLAGNGRYTLRVALSMLHHAAPDRLKGYLPNYMPAPMDDGLEIPGTTGHFPSAAYLEVIGD